MAASAICTINGSVPSGPVLLTPGTTCTVALVSTAGASDVSLAFTGASETVTYPTITRTGFGTFTFTVPANPGHGAGLSLNLTCRNTGDEFKMLVCVGTTNMIASNETTERGALGWAEQLNTNFRATVTGRVEFATHAAYRAAAELADGTFFTIVSPPGEWRYSASSGAGFTDDDRTILKRTGVLDAANGRAFSTRAGATVPTFDALRGLRGSNQDHVHVQAHTTFGDGGGGIFDRAAIGSYVDDGGTIATAGSNAWVRREAGNGNAKLTWWGADKTGTVASDDAFDAAYAWVLANYSRTYKTRSIYIPDGLFVLNRRHEIAIDIVILGNGRTSTLHKGTASADSMLVWTQPRNVTLKNFRISGVASCGKAALDVTEGSGGWIEFDVDLVITGGWTAQLYVDGSMATGRGAFQWGKIKLSNLQMSADGAPYYPGQHGIYMTAGYFNCCWLHVDYQGLTGDSVHIEPMPDYPNPGWFELTGSSQACNRGCYIRGVTSGTLRYWAEELNTNPSHYQDLYQFRFERVGAYGTPTLQAVRRCKFDLCYWPIAEDADCEDNEFTDSGADAIPHARANLAQIITRGNEGPFGRNGGGQGYVDPPNILLGGDMSSWNYSEGSHSQIRTANGNYSATKCGVGQANTMHPRDTKWCALLTEGSLTPGQPWFAQFRLFPAIDDSLLGVPVVATVKVRPYSGTPLTGFAVAIGDYTAAGAPTGGVECEDGWTLFTFSRRIDATMVASGASVVVYGNAGTQFYVAELTGTIGYHGPRIFSRCERSPFYPGSLDENGSYLFYTDAEPSGSDPIWSRTYIEGDTGIVTSPVVESDAGGDFITTAYKRGSSSWITMQMSTGRVGIP